jgi:DNA-binding transcriptional MerR regulator
VAGPDEQMTIGEFARRSRLSVKALRLYERTGLLVPAHVSPENGYRRYHANQLYVARLIVMLRRLDMPLAVVARVNTDSDGPVEVCVPVESAPASMASRVEPEHCEAYVTITKAQFEMPIIMSLYDALDQWIATHGLQRVGSPREVYRAGVDPDAAAPSDEICDVAAPVCPANGQ